MKVDAKIRFDFSSIAKSMKMDRCSNREIREEIRDIIRTGEYFPEQVLDCEVIFHE